MKLNDPIFLLVLIPFVFLIFLRREGKYLGYSSTSHLEGGKSAKVFIRRLPKVLCFVAVLFAIFAFSRPQLNYHETEVSYRGREIILSIDTSFSMTGEAMEVIREISKGFIKKRVHDMIGITMYGTDAVVVVLPTRETELLEKSLDRIKPHQVGVRTAIGEGLFTSILALIEREIGQVFEINKLRKSMNREEGLGKYALDFVKMVHNKGTMNNKVIVLFTDGIYNVGINPERPLRFIKRLGVKVHVVSVPASAETGVEHEQAAERTALLRKGVESTGGRLFEAENYEEVEQFYSEIDKIEKEKIIMETVVKKKDMFFLPTAISICLLLGMVAIENIWLKIP